LELLKAISGERAPVRDGEFSRGTVSMRDRQALVGAGCLPPLLPTRPRGCL